MRVFIGCNEICGLINIYRMAFENLGHYVTTCTSTINKYYPNETYDLYTNHLTNFFTDKKSLIDFNGKFSLLNRVLSKARLSGYLNNTFEKKIVDQHDLFIFLWAGEYLMPGTTMLKSIKRKKKQIVSLLMGSDVRYAPAFSEHYDTKVDGWPAEYIGSYSYYNKQIRNVEIYSDLIFSVPDQMSLAIRPYNHLLLPVELKRFKFKNNNRDVPIVVHAPSNPAIKGSDIIMETFHKLKNNGIQFEIRLIENLTNSDLLKVLTDSDIVVDELVLHGPGVLGNEAMASGCVEMTRFLSANAEIFKPPIIPVTKENLYSRLKEVIINKLLRFELIEEGRKYIEEQHSSEKIVSDILKQLHSKRQNNYYPKYFLESFKLPTGEQATALDKELTKLVALEWDSEFIMHEESLKLRRLI